MKIKIAVIAALLLCGVIACDQKTKKQDLESLKSEVKEMTLDQTAQEEQVEFNTDTTTVPPSEDDHRKKKQPVTEKSLPNPDWDKKIIKTADLNIEVKDYNAYYSKLRENIKNSGGYLAQEDQTQSDYKIENRLTIKVPVEQFDNAVSRFTTEVEKVNEKRVTSQDVTAEYVDTKSRIEAKRQVRLRYMDLLKQAKNMEEILNVQSEINDIQEEIESASGRIEYLGHSSAYSTINLTYYQVLNPSAMANDTPNFGTKLSGAFKTGWSWVTDLFIGLISIWPLFFLVLLGVIFYKRSRPKKLKEA